MKPIAGSCPIAGMMVSHGISNSEPGIATGTARPFFSIVVRKLRSQTSAFMRPSSVRTRTGLVSSKILMPSWSIASISPRSAGISVMVRRYAMATLPSGPTRRYAVRAASMAVFPPPMITTCRPNGVSLFCFTANKNSSGSITPGVSMPSISSFTDLWAPAARKTASYSRSRRTDSFLSMGWLS